MHDVFLREKNPEYNKVEGSKIILWKLIQSYSRDDKPHHRVTYRNVETVICRAQRKGKCKSRVVNLSFYP